MSSISSSVTRAGTSNVGVDTNDKLGSASVADTVSATGATIQNDAATQTAQSDSTQAQNSATATTADTTSTTEAATSSSSTATATSTTNETTPTVSSQTAADTASASKNESSSNTSNPNTLTASTSSSVATINGSRTVLAVSQTSSISGTTDQSQITTTSITDASATASNPINTVLTTIPKTTGTSTAFINAPTTQSPVGNIGSDSDNNNRSSSSLSKPTIIGLSTAAGVVALLAALLLLAKILRNRRRHRRDAEWDSDFNNKEINFDVASLDNGGGVEALSRVNSRSSQISTGSLRQPPMAYVDSSGYGNVATGYGYGPTGAGTATPYGTGYGATGYNNTNPIAPVTNVSAAIPNTYNYNYGIGPNYADMAAIGPTTAAAGVAGIGVARTRSVKGNGNNTTVTSPADTNSRYPTDSPSASSMSGGGTYSPMTAPSMSTITGTQGLERKESKKGFSAFGDSPGHIGMSQMNASTNSFEKLRGWKN